MDAEAIEEPLADGDPDPGGTTDATEPAVRALPRAPIRRGADVLARRGPRDRRRRRRRHCRRRRHRCRGQRRQGDVGEPQPAAVRGAAGAIATWSPVARSWSTFTCSGADAGRGDRVARGPGGSLVVEVRPPCSYRLPLARRYPDGVARSRSGVYERFLHVAGRPVLTRAWGLPRGEVAIAALPAPAAWLRLRRGRGRDAARISRSPSAGPATRSPSTTTCGRFLARFARDPLLAPADPAGCPGTASGAARTPGRPSPGRSPSS